MNNGWKLAWAGGIATIAGAAALAQPVPGMQLSMAATKVAQHANAVREATPVIPVVVVVRDARSYVAAISAWSGKGRFPVLIDDGTWGAREDIARFVRGFAPRQVVTWSGGQDLLWSDTPAVRQAAVESTIAHVWGVEKYADLPGALKAAKVMPSGGVVATGAADPAWTAGLALAAGRGQPLVWVTNPGTVTGQMTMVQAMEMSRQITAFLDSQGWKYDRLGDDIDAVTLALNCPVRVEYAAPPKPIAPGRMGNFRLVPGEPVATTDVIGRTDSDDRVARWAWCGQVIGSEAEAAYRAMCGLFLTPGSAWLFDGYDLTEPWIRFNLSTTARALKDYGVTTTLFDQNRNTLSDWRLAVTRPVNAGLLMINSKGLTWHFDLNPGQGLRGDVPMLQVPAVISMVHSWSAYSPSNRMTIGGRFIAHGAFAYVGSVHEPLLQAFIPSPIFALRLATDWPLGAAFRLDEATPWRITLIGDPLITLGHPVKRTDAALPLQNAREVRVPAAAPDARDADALWALVMGGDDAEAVARFKASLRDPKAPPAPEAALAAGMAAFRIGDNESLCEAFRLALPQIEKAPDLKDALWQALYPELRRLSRPRIALLAKAVREEQTLRDAGDVYDLIVATDGKAAAKAVLVHLRKQATDEQSRKDLDLLIAKAP